MINRNVFHHDYYGGGWHIGIYMYACLGLLINVSDFDVRNFEWEKEMSNVNY